MESGWEGTECVESCCKVGRRSLLCGTYKLTLNEFLFADSHITSRNRLLLLVAFSYLLYTSFVVQKLGFKHRYEYRQLDIAFPFSNASASLHFKAGNRLYQYLSPEIDFGHGLQRNASLECQDKHTCPGYALSYVKVCSACTDVTASLERNCAFVPGIDEEICSWSSPYSKAELDELPTHLLSSKVTERPFINSTSNPGEVLSVTSIQWADRTAPKLEPVATECTLDLCGVLLDISEHISPERKNTAAREILLDLYAPLIPFDNVVGGFPLELERADVSSLRELVAGSLTGEVVSDYLTNEDAASEQLSYLAKNVKNDDIKADLANLASSLARLLSQSIRSDVYQHLKDGDEPWKFSKRVDLLRFSLARYLPVIAALFAMQLFYNGLILAKGLGLPVLSRSPWSLAVMLAVVDVTKSSDVKVYLKNVELMQTDEVHFEVGEASEAGDESREASLDVGEKFVGQA